MENKITDKLLLALFTVMLPIKMLLKFYSFSILMVDIMWVIFNTLVAVVQACYELFRPPPLKPVDSETALVIGSGRGIGRHIAIQLSDLGAIVLCVDKNKTTNDETVKYIKSGGGFAYAYTYNISVKENIEELVQRVKKDHGFVSMLFYCCGIPSPRTLYLELPQDINETLKLCLTSYYWLIDHFLPDMKNKNHGHIVALTSVAGTSYAKNQMPLSIAQFAVHGLAETLIEDVRASRKEGVHVSLIHVYPFIVGEESPDIVKLRIPSYFGTITPQAAAECVLNSVRRNVPEASVPMHLHCLGHLLRILPRKATALIRDLLDTGVDFA